MTEFQHPATGWGAQGVSDGPSAASLDNLFSEDVGTERMLMLLRDPSVHDIRINGHDRVFYSDGTGPKMLIDRVFAGPGQYASTINQLLALTDVGYTDFRNCPETFIEGSFRVDKTDLRGSVFLVTSKLTGGEPALVVRKQPQGLITLDQMLEQGMMRSDMRLFLELAVRGKLNMFVAGGGGAGKTTLLRALSWFIDPAQRVITVEDIDELHLKDRLPNVVALKTWRDADEHGGVRRQDDLDDLVRHALRMRADRIVVGELRGKEAYAIVKACLSGHDGSLTTLHANDAAQALRQLVSYVMESHLTEEVARDQVAQAFHLGIHLSKVKLGRRVITEIVELEPTREGSEQRRNPLWKYDFGSEAFVRVGAPSQRLRQILERNNVNLADLDRLADSSRWG